MVSFVLEMPVEIAKTSSLLNTGVTSSVKERCKGRCQNGVGGCGGGDVCKEGRPRRPRNPDGSGPMYVVLSVLRLPFSPSTPHTC